MIEILVVGAGFAGAVYARELADAGYKVQVIDQRDHIAGNAYDLRDESGVIYHKYGPHLFHTSNEKVFTWLSRFTQWYNYRHKVVALYNQQRCPLPINRETINKVYGKNLKSRDEALEFIQKIKENNPNASNAKEVLHNKIGKRLTEIFFEPYTRKMWGMSLSEMAPSVVERLDFKLEESGEYFPNDLYQMMPLDGYTPMFERILAHKNIRVDLNTKYEKKMSKAYAHTFNSMPIDEYFEFQHGQLPYRSIKFKLERGHFDEAYSTVNFTDEEKYTRATYWNNLSQRATGEKNVIRTLEEPCDYKDNNFERYYPIKDWAGVHRKTYEKYLEVAKQDRNLTFIGRCGTYQYLDMHQVVNQSLQGAKKYIEENRK